MSGNICQVFFKLSKSVSYSYNTRYSDLWHDKPEARKSGNFERFLQNYLIHIYNKLNKEYYTLKQKYVLSGLRKREK